MHSLFDLHTWIQWDQSHYLEIAKSGYRAFPCSPDSGFNQGDWCGNAAWFPFFPLLIAAISALSSNAISIEILGLLISNVFFVATLLYVLPLLSVDLGCKSKYSNTLFRSAFFILFPSSIFFHANYPLSLALFSAGLSLHYVYTNKPLQSIPLSFIACSSYPPMIVLSVPIAIYSLFEFARLQYNKANAYLVIPLILSIATPVATYLASQLYIDVKTGVTGSFALVGEKYGHGVHNPLYALKSLLIRSSQLNEFSSLQSFFLISCLCCILVTTILELINTKSSRTISLSSVSAKDLSLFSSALVFIILPMIVGGAVSTYRTESLSALAMIVMIDKIIKDNILRYLVLFASSVLFITSLKLFLEGRLV